MTNIWKEPSRLPKLKPYKGNDRVLRSDPVLVIVGEGDKRDLRLAVVEVWSPAYSDGQDDPDWLLLDTEDSITEDVKLWTEAPAMPTT